MTETHQHQHQHHEQHRTIERHVDVAVIGGSAAGLAAALQLARQRRTVVVVDDGSPRNAPAAHLHGYLGREGAAPADLLAIGREEVRSYGGEVLAGRVLAVRRDGDELTGRLRVELTGGHALLARRLLVATGIVDELPDIEGLARHWGSEVFVCPFCHGYEVRDQRVVQVLTHPMGLHPTRLLRHLTSSLTVVVQGEAAAAEAAEELGQLESAGVRVVRGEARRLVSDAAGVLCGVELGDGTTLAADAVLVGSTFRPRLEMTAPVGVPTAAHPSGLGEVALVDPFGQTGRPGVYAAGSVTDPGLQVLASAAHGSKVAAMIAFSLAEDDLRAGARASGERADWEHRYAGEVPMWSANPNGTLVAEAAALHPGRALDVGAGEGADALWLAERGWTVTASDISANALARVDAEARRRGLDVRLLHADANQPDAFGAADSEAGEAYDLVSLQYGSFLRTPDGRGLAHLLGAVAPGGTLLVVAHDLTPLRGPADVATETRMWDPEAYVGVDAIAAALAGDPGWRVEVHETRPRPPGAATGHHVDDVVLRAVRV